jgi:hypothetical protein
MKRIGILLAAGLIFLALANWIKLSSPDPAAEAQQAYRRGDYRRALEKFRQAARDTSDPARAAHNQAATLARLRRYGEAEKYYQCEQEGGGDRRAARTAYDLANCEVQQARRKSADGKDQTDPALLARAVDHYRNCLKQETGRGGQLFADARHNLELAKTLLADAEDPAAKSGESAKGQKEEPKGQSESTKGQKQSTDGQPDSGNTALARNETRKESAKDLLKEAAKDKEDLCPT